MYVQYLVLHCTSPTPLACAHAAICTLHPQHAWPVPRAWAWAWVWACGLNLENSYCKTATVIVIIGPGWTGIEGRQTVGLAWVGSAGPEEMLLIDRTQGFDLGGLLSDRCHDSRVRTYCVVRMPCHALPYRITAWGMKKRKEVTRKRGKFKHGLLE